ncbi:murein transglycosylase A [Desulfobulbus alkaliphilus]|uniref:murein transglycosylase A n=1 Tax=Desulfobulbus alkaliphilus TaxID=869814 RepID=UPI001F0627FE|nr:MltA domain-containing protein [Desulfobulbus alkaliphilus]
MFSVFFLFSLPVATAASTPKFKDDLDYQGLDQALVVSLVHLRNLAGTTRYTVAGESVTVERLIDTAESFRKLIAQRPSAAELNRLIQEHYTVVRIDSGVSRSLLVTGYYHPYFQGSLQRRAPYLYPLYGVPESLVVRPAQGAGMEIGRLEEGRFVPFWTREEIESGNLLRESELVWLKDRFDAFVLHVQGSGVIVLPDGSLRRVQYARSNGRPYRSIGKYLVDTGRMQLADVTMDSIRHYLEQHPEEVDQILHWNQSFIFFHWAEAGPVIGSLGRQLTAGRSIAADHRYYPPGSLVYLDSRQPLLTDDQGEGWQPLQRFVTVQDTGSALKGPARVDLFWGAGDLAGRAAGRMKEDGAAYLLLRRQ